MFVDLLQSALRTGPFAGPMQADFQPGEGRLAVVTGDNTSGKTFFGRWFKEEATDKRIECPDFGMARRAGAGFGRMMYGLGENLTSTGANSVTAVLGAFRNSREQWREPHCLLFDEPDIGLSEAYQGALGQYFAQAIPALPEACLGTVIVTHSRRLLRHLLPLTPHHIRFGDQLTLRDLTAAEPPDHTVAELEALFGTGMERMRAIKHWAE